jgi:hypothetical protein
MTDKTGIVQALLDAGYGQAGGGRPSGNGTVPQYAFVRYQMRAWHTGLAAFVLWQVTGNPDKTGAQSGYTPGDLTEIGWTAVRYKAL